MKVALATSTVERKQATSNSMKINNLLSEDGKLLKGSKSGETANPCFDEERIARNRLLLLMCTLELSKSQPLTVSHQS